MISTTESGHGHNLANLKAALTFVLGLGNDYKPGNPLLAVSKIQSLIALADEVTADVQRTRADHQTAVKARALGFEELLPRMTRLKGALAALPVGEHTRKHVATATTRARGGRVKAVKTLTEEQKAQGMEEPRTVSVSQQSFVKLLEHLAVAISVLEADSNFKPNEADLQVEALRKLHAGLEKLMTAESEAYVAYSNALIARDEVYYAPATGVVAVGMALKGYVLSVYGAKSMAFRRVKGFMFRMRKVKGVKLEEPTLPQPKTA